MVSRVDDFILGSTLGKGFSATVKSARKENEIKEYALKIFTLTEDA